MYREDIIGALRIVARAGGESDAASESYQDADIFSAMPLDRARDNLSHYVSA